MTTRLLESTGTLTSANGGKYRVRLISEGVGSSGTYPADVLERDGAAAWPKGTQIFFDHLTSTDEWERAGNHSIKDLVGILVTDPEYDTAEKALYAEAQFVAQHRTFIEEVKDHVGLSVEAKGTIVDGIVESIAPSPLNAVAVVPRAGRDGKIVELVESYRDSNNSGIIETHTASNEAETGKDEGMTPEQIAELREALVTAVTSGIAEIKESLKPAPVEQTEENVETPKVADVAEAVVAADLPASARKRVYEALEANPEADVATVIEAEKAYLTEVREALAKDAGADLGRIRESSKPQDNDDDFSVSGW